MNQRLFNRFLLLIVLLSTLIILLFGRLIYIQLLATENFSSRGVNLIKKSVQQRQQQFTLHSGRGEITDRYGQALTGKSTYVVALFPFAKMSMQSKDRVKEVAEIVQISAPIVEIISKLEEPLLLKTAGKLVEITEEQAQAINDLEIPGILGLPYELRYNQQEHFAQHFIGYLGENAEMVRMLYAQELARGSMKENTEIGISGLERTFQSFLAGLGPSTLAYVVDGRGLPLSGLPVKYVGQENVFYPLGVQTTLDLEIQQEVEQILDRHQIAEGALVVLDTQTSEIVAMASRPNFTNQMSDQRTWENKALKRYPLGSVFKVVIASAALEERLVNLNQRYYCPATVEGEHLQCWKKEGHGSLTFAEGFAESCNVVFGEIAQQLGPQVIAAYAQKLGLTERNGWHTDSLYRLEDFKQLDREESGQVFAANRSLEEQEDLLYLWQTGIGQLDVQATPLAVANMLTAIIRGGTKYQVKGVEQILYNTGASFYQFKQQKLEGPSISRYTAYQLQQLLALVTSDGTASAQLRGKQWKAAGKTGTAELGRSSGVNQDRNHQWFAGYYPQNYPRYAVVALTLNKKANTSNQSLTIFTELIDWLDTRT